MTNAEEDAKLYRTIKRLKAEGYSAKGVCKKLNLDLRDLKRIKERVQYQKSKKGKSDGKIEKRKEG